MEKNFTGLVDAKHGKFIFCHFDEYVGLSLREYGEFSEIELNFMNNFISKDDIVLDIGSNIGAFTIPFAKKVGYNGKVIAFEPQDFIFKILNGNIALNSLRNVESHNIGLGKNNEYKYLNDVDYSEVGNFGGFSMHGVQKNNEFLKLRKNKNKIIIQKLDNFLHLKKCNFLKMDAEGMEQNILLGGEKFINKYRPIMFIENNPTFPNDLNYKIMKKNYKVYWFFSLYYNSRNYFVNNRNYFKECNAGKDVGTHNIICIPEEKKINLSLDSIEDKYSKPLVCFTDYYKPTSQHNNSEKNLI